MIKTLGRRRVSIGSTAICAALVATLVGGCANTTTGSSASASGSQATSAQSATSDAASQATSEATSTQSAAASATSQAETELFTIDDELRVRLNRSELENMKLVDGPIYVSGHTSPDADTVCSAIAYADLLTKLGYDARPVVLGDVNAETAYILKEAGVAAPEKLEDASGVNMILVDHGEYEHSVKGLEDANIVAIIDHHNDGSVETSQPILYDARPIGSTATIIWMRYYNYGIEPDATISKLIMGAILSDTSNLKSDSTTTADREILPIVAAEAGVEDTDAFYANQYKASIAYDGMTDEEIFASDLKTYDKNGQTYAIGVVQAYDEPTAQDLATRMKAILPAQAKALDVKYCFAQVSIYHDDVSVTYLVPMDDASSEVLKAAYGDTATFDGTSYVLKPGISRKTRLVPDIDAVLEAHPKE